MRNASRTGLTMITGPAWSGKTKFAQTLLPAPDEVLWIGTGSRQDPAFSQYIDQIAARRPPQWTTVEETLHLSALLHKTPHKKTPLVIDSVSQWLANVIATDCSKYSATQIFDHLQNETSTFIDVLKGQYSDRQVIVVTAEAGWSVAPESSTQATLRRALGSLNQELAAMASTVYLVCAGIGQTLKSLS